jgi:hypothetical protein
MARAAELREDFELLGHWGQYMCVLVAGFLENSIQELYGDRVKRTASSDVQSFVVRSLDRIQNPNAQRFHEVAGAFNTQWGADLDLYLDQDAGRRRNALNSIMSNRHLIAHGGNSAISVGRVREYLDASLEVLDFIEEQCA